MTSWIIEYTEPAEADLDDIFCYIAETLRVPGTAKEQIVRIIERISTLDSMPKRYPLYNKGKWRALGLRRTNVDNFAIFYIPDKTGRIVTIMRILYGGRDIDKIMQG
jgi:toxin ParE1/3/4